jgi:hypothetical protein
LLDDTQVSVPWHQRCELHCTLAVLIDGCQASLKKCGFCLICRSWSDSAVGPLSMHAPIQNDQIQDSSHNHPRLISPATSQRQLRAAQVTHGSPKKTKQGQAITSGVTEIGTPTSTTPLLGCIELRATCQHRAGESQHCEPTQPKSCLCQMLGCRPQSP